MSGKLGTQFRGKLADSYGQRGGYDSNLWYVYSPRTSRDWVLRCEAILPLRQVSEGMEEHPI